MRTQLVGRLATRCETFARVGDTYQLTPGHATVAGSHKFVASLSTSCNNAVISSSCYTIVAYDLLTDCRIAGR